MRISVVIPMYNAKDSIKSAIDSVFEQSYKEEIEIIIINDGSKDGCEKVVEEIILDNKTNRIIRLINKQNGGAASARNEGISKSEGDWIALLDADDTWYPEKLEKQINIINSSNQNIRFLGANTNVHKYILFNKSSQKVFALNSKELLWQWYPQTSTILVKKELLLEMNLYDEMRYGEDCDMYLKITQKEPIYILNEILVDYDGGKRGFGISGMTSKLFEMHSGEIIALQRAYKRGQLKLLEYIGFNVWLKMKYYRRVLIVNFKSYFYKS